MTEFSGLTLIYGVPAVLAYLFWLSPWMVRRLISLWVGRDVMLSLIPKAKHVWHLERITGIVKRKP